MAIGVQVRRLRTEQRFSQEELARRAGLSRTAVARIERGERSPAAESIERIARALDVEPGELFPKVLAR